MLFGELPDPLAGDLLAGLVGLVLDDAGELDLGTAWQADMMVCLQEIGGARLPDCEFTRMIASKVRPISPGSMGR